MNHYPHEEKKKLPVSASAVVRIVIWSVVLCILVGLAGLLTLDILYGNDGNFAWGIRTGGYSYDEAESYRVGNGEFTDAINELDIEWIDGDVEIVPTDGDTVTVTESYSGDDDDLRMRWKVENGRLTVKYRAPYWLIGVGKSVSKTLTVSVPSEMLDSLYELDVSTVSGDLTVQANATVADIETVSGKLNIKGKFDTLDVETVSGDITVEGAVNEADFDGVSATVKLVLSEQAMSVDVDTTSGDVTVILPTNVSGFEANMDSVSGQIEVRGFDDVSSGTGKFHRTWGDGSMKITMDGVSAKLFIEKETNS